MTKFSILISPKKGQNLVIVPLYMDLPKLITQTSFLAITKTKLRLQQWSWAIRRLILVKLIPISFDRLTFLLSLYIKTRDEEMEDSEMVLF